jgi:hypothetical protein
LKEAVGELDAVVIGVDPKGVDRSSRIHEICGRERG